ncbi:MAG: helix-turn-helix domain-containing protein [Pseudomonadales bacterium]|nr:helix-turn-helix domain-containing protein [Pseudomonadales bacterium]
MVLEKEKFISILVHGLMDPFELGSAIVSFGNPDQLPVNPKVSVNFVVFDEKGKAGCRQLHLNEVHLINSVPRIDVLVIPGWTDLYSSPANHWVNTIIDLYNRGCLLIGLGSGIYVPALMGLLSGEKVAAGTKEKPVLDDLFPDVRFITNVPFTLHSGCICTKGGTSSLTLCNRLAKQIIHLPKSTGPTKALSLIGDARRGLTDTLHNYLPRRASCKNKLEMAIQWATLNIQDVKGVGCLVERSCLSRRSFDRNFKKLMNTSAWEWITARRLELAKQLLETGELTIEEIADISGFGSSINLRNNFKQEMEIPPSQYRENSGVIIKSGVCPASSVTY